MAFGKSEQKRQQPMLTNEGIWLKPKEFNISFTPSSYMTTQGKSLTTFPSGPLCTAQDSMHLTAEELINQSSLWIHLNSHQQLKYPPWYHCLKIVVGAHRGPWRSNPQWSFWYQNTVDEVMSAKIRARFLRSRMILMYGSFPTAESQPELKEGGNRLSSWADVQ